MYVRIQFYQLVLKFNTFNGMSELGTFTPDIVFNGLKVCINIYKRAFIRETQNNFLLGYF